MTRWDDSKLLTVVVDRLERWSAPGVPCIGDAAHVMSPIGGVGINLAIQDAIAAANRLAPALRAHRVTTDALAAVQARRAPQDPGASGRDPGPHARPGAGRPDRGRAADRGSRSATSPPLRRAMARRLAVGQSAGASDALEGDMYEEGSGRSTWR